MEAHDLETRDKYLDLLQENKYITKRKQKKMKATMGMWTQDCKTWTNISQNAFFVRVCVVLITSHFGFFFFSIRLSLSLEDKTVNSIVNRNVAYTDRKRLHTHTRSRLHFPLTPSLSPKKKKNAHDP